MWLIIVTIINTAKPDLTCDMTGLLYYLVNRRLSLLCSVYDENQIVALSVDWIGFM